MEPDQHQDGGDRGAGWAATIAVMTDAAALDWVLALERPDLLAPSTEEVLRALPVDLTGQVRVAEIDPDVADTAALVAASDIALEDCANCVLVTGRRAGEARTAAALVLGTSRADVNNVVKRTLDVRKATFLAREDALAATGMEYGGITPVGLPESWPVLVDPSVVARERVVIGSGVRRSKLSLPGTVVAQLPGVQVVEGLAMPG